MRPDVSTRAGRMLTCAYQSCLGGRRAAEAELEAVLAQTQAAAEAMTTREGLEHQLLAARAELAEVRR